MNHAKDVELQLIRRTAEDYQAKGYTVSLDVSLDFFPEFRADLVVQKGTDRRVIEVKKRSSLAADPKIMELAQIIEDKPGWNFDLLIVSEPETLASPEDAHPFVPNDVTKRIREAKEALELGLSTSAFILAWSALEAVTRILSVSQWADDANIETSAFNLNHAFALGVLSPEDYVKLDKLLRLRNAVVHGFSVKDVDDDLARDLIETVGKFQGAVPHAFMRAFMRRWFFARYEDPVHSLPYESREGGYIWLYGEPRDAREVLYEEFDEVVPADAIEALADDLSDECSEWTPRADPDKTVQGAAYLGGLMGQG